MGKPRVYLYACERALAIIREPTPAADPVAVAFAAVAFIVGDDTRLSRFLALTGLDGAGLRASITDRAVQAAALEFLANHEPDLVAAAVALDITPETLKSAWESLR